MVLWLANFNAPKLFTTYTLYTVFNHFNPKQDATGVNPKGVAV